MDLTHGNDAVTCRKWGVPKVGNVVTLHTFFGHLTGAMVANSEQLEEGVAPCHSCPDPSLG